MRFDDSLSTVLSGDLNAAAGARAAWRQLVDLVGRGRAPADEATLVRLRALRGEVPAEVRAASARPLAFATPPAALVALFAEDELAVAAPVLRTAVLDDADWLALLPRLDARGRSVLRHRRDLSVEVRRGLERFGGTDFVLVHDRPVVADRPHAVPPAVEAPVIEAALPSAPPAPPAIVTPTPPVESPPAVTATVEAPDTASGDAAPRFEIADLIARIDGAAGVRAEAPARSPAPAATAHFLFETDATGTVTWVEGAARGALVGLRLAKPAKGMLGTDAVVAGALRRRDRFVDARLEIGGDVPSAGSWRLSGTPLFDEASGRFIGMRGVGRRARADQRAEPVGTRVSPAADSLRQLVHELRTPANAIMGFAELIESELLGPVPVHYKAQAGMIRDEAAGLVDAIEDLDTAARIEGRALELRPGSVALAPLIAGVGDDLRPLAFLRGVDLVVDADERLPAVSGDDRALQRLVSRLLSALVAAGGAGERIGVTARAGEGGVILAIDRPRALDADTEAALFSLDAAEDERPGAPLLGIGFTLRLARNLAAELGGALAIEATRLTLRLPVASDPGMRAAAI